MKEYTMILTAKERESHIRAYLDHGFKVIEETDRHIKISDGATCTIVYLK